MNEMLTCVVVAVLAPLLTHGSESFTVHVADSVITGTVGSSVILPCWLGTLQDIQDMEIRWYRPQKFNTPVLFYSNHEIKTDVQDWSYINRSSLTLREAQSAGLKGGDLSLKLENLKKDDEGTYLCYVSGEKEYGSNHVNLNVNVPGSSPVLSLQLQDDRVNVSCRTCGWRPKPHVEWKSDQAATLRPKDLFHWNGKDNLTCIQSWVLLSPSDSHLASCYVSVSGVVKDSSVDIQNIAHQTEHGSASWKALFAVAVLVALAMIAVSVFFYKKYKTGYMRAKTDEEAQQSVCHHSKSVCEDLKKDAVNITLDKSKVHPDLAVNYESNLVRDKRGAAANLGGPGFPFCLSVNAMNSFSSGRAYWEVGLTAENVKQVKKTWLIGVCKVSNFLTNDKRDLTPSKGFWFLYSDGPNGIQVNTEPEILLTVDPTPEIIGVLLDYDKNELLFYNAKEGVHLFTMKTKFQGEIVPMFNPGIGDEAPLKIIPQTESSSLSEPKKDSSAEKGASADGYTDQPTQ